MRPGGPAYEAPPRIRVHSSVAPILATMIALQGCALTVQEEWNPHPTLPPLQPTYVEVPDSELPGVCGNHPGMSLYGCARRDYAARICVVYTGPWPAEWLLDHERKHCAGWDHSPRNDAK